MTDKRYWVWLQLGIGAEADIKAILSEYKTPEGVYNATIIEWKNDGSLSSARIDRLSELSLEDADRIIDECNNNSWDIITYDDERYPEMLRDIPKPPAVLYVSGDIGCLKDRLAVSMVGTRKASSYSLKAAQYLSKGIAKCGAVIVSGGALGVDSASHEGALEAGGKTVAVLGCGLGTDYLKSNESLRRKIIENGALITEYPPHKRADRITFPQRNRIISGLSRALVVVEAAEKSGSLITAEYSKKQGRDIFAIPASIFDPAFQGTNKLIDEGAFVATSPRAVVLRYADEYYTLDVSKAESMYEISNIDLGANAPEKKQLTFDNIKSERAADSERQDKAVSLKGNEKAVYDAFSDGLILPEELEASTGLSNLDIITALSILEIKGLIKKCEGDRYSKV